MMKDAQTKIQLLLNHLVDEGREQGLQVAAYLEGELVVDAWAGVADRSTGRPVDGETLFPVFSCTKGVLATLIHRLVETGKLSYETRIAEVWPEFGVNGKEGITLDQVLWHTSAIPYMPAGVGLAEIHDWKTICAEIVQLTPAWQPGTRAEYHAITFGWILGETARRVDGRPFQQRLQEEIRQPLGIEGLYVGIPDEVESRVATLENTEISPEPDPSKPQGTAPCMRPLSSYMNSPEARRACLPASNGIMNARALARLYASLLPGGIDGVELLTPERVRLATAWERPGDQLAPAATYPMRVGGYMLFGDVRKQLPTFGHDGYGGACGFADPKHKLSVGLTKNLFSSQGAQLLIVAELRKALRLA